VVLLVEPWGDGSHRQWGEGLRQYSRHRIDIVSLPGRAWRWRLRAGAKELGQQVRAWISTNGQPDVVLVSGMTDVAQLLGFVRRDLASSVPVVVYQHESQLVYPSADGGYDSEAVVHNWLSWCVADRVLFNTDVHRRQIIERLPPFLRGMPETDASGPSLVKEADALFGRFFVVPVGIDPVGIDPVGVDPADVAELPTNPKSPTGGGGVPSAAPRNQQDGGPLILWPHRWEADKDPEAFANALERLENAGLPFRLVLAGQDPDGVGSVGPEIRAGIVERFGSRVEAQGPFTQDIYRRWLWQSDMVVSCAHQEQFGVAVVEAVARGCVPVLPDDLSYPEVIPERWHPVALYRRGRFGTALVEAVTDFADRQQACAGLAAAMRRYEWPRLVSMYDDHFDQLAAGE